MPATCLTLPATTIPRQLLEEALARADAAAVSPWVDPVECLCGRSDTYVTYADMVIAADQASARGRLASGPSYDVAWSALTPIVTAPLGAGPATDGSPRWPGPSAVQLIQRAARDLETALQLEEEDQASILASMGDLHLSLFRAAPDPDLPSAAGQVQALALALDWYRRARSIPFKPYRNLETAYNMATVYALLGSAEDEACARMLQEWLELLGEQRGQAAEAAAAALADLTADADFAAFLQRPMGTALLQRLHAVAARS